MQAKRSVKSMGELYFLPLLTYSYTKQRGTPGRNPFLPREAVMLARSLDRNSVCLSVFPSVTRVLCDETKERIRYFETT